MAKYKITIQPVSQGATLEANEGCRPGTLDYLKRPFGPVVATVEATAAQIQGIQGYIQGIKNAQDTSGVETEVDLLVL